MALEGVDRGGGVGLVGLDGGCASGLTGVALMTTPPPRR